MTHSIQNVITLAPVRVHLGLKVGANENTKGYYDFLEELQGFPGVVEVPALTPQSLFYESLSSDVYDIRLFVWDYKDEENQASLRFHVFPNSLAVVETVIASIQYDDAEDLEKKTQKISKLVIREAYKSFYKLLSRLSYEAGHGLLIPISKLVNLESYNPQKGPDIRWVARTLVFSPESLKQEHNKTLIRDWLKETQTPTDGDAIINGSKTYSMTWLNYVIVENERHCQRFLIDTMLLAQYYYTAQALCNDRLKGAISDAYLSDKLANVESKLGLSRAVARLLQVDFHEHLKHLTRPKRKTLEEILDSWDYNDLVDNGQRMIRVCSDKLMEANHQKRERSSTLTDLLLVPLSLFAVFELALSLTEFSREMMSRPALDYQDESSSIVLSAIATVDADIMISLGFALTLFLGALYAHIKTR